MAKRPCCAMDSHNLLLLHQSSNPNSVPSKLDQIMDMDSMLSTFLDSSIPSLDLSFERLLESRDSISDQNLLIDRAHNLASALLEAAKRSTRKRSSLHNSIVWVLPPDLTVKGPFFSLPRAFNCPGPGLAGSDTSATTVDWAMVEMMRHPKVMEKAQAEVRWVFDIKGGKVDETHFHELEYLKLVIKETLRLHPVSPLIPRECSETCEINGYEIPIKSKLVINNVWAIGRDPNYWTEPENFIPERFLGNPVDFKGTYHDFIPFGAGRRMYPGIIYATMNVEVQLVHLLYHFDWKLPNGIKKEDIDLTENFGITVRRKDDLYLVPISYNHHESSIAGAGAGGVS